MIPKRNFKLERIRRARKPESELQEVCEKYAALRNVETFHLPQILLNNAFSRRAAYGGEIWALREAAARVKGMPDLTLFFKGRYRMVELKTEIGKLSREQMRWLNRHPGACIRTFEDFKKYLDDFISEVEHAPGSAGGSLVSDGPTRPPEAGTENRGNP